MESIYDRDIFSPIEKDLECFTQKFVLAPELWGKFKIEDLKELDFSKWESIKLIQNGSFSPEIKKIPNEFGGIYIYCIEPHIIPNAGSYIMYIGKAKKTDYENLRRRISSYNSCLTDDETRPRLHRLFEKWGDYVYVHYLPIACNEDVIAALEDRLIAAYGKPPCNADVRIKSVKLAVRAFN